MIKCIDSNRGSKILRQTKSWAVLNLNKYIPIPRNRMIFLNTYLSQIGHVNYLKIQHQIYFFSKSIAIHSRSLLFRKYDSFFKSPNLQKKYSKFLSLAWNLNLLFTVIGGKYKFQVQDSNLEYLFRRFGDLKNTSHFLKKATFKVWIL